MPRPSILPSRDIPVSTGPPFGLLLDVRGTAAELPWDSETGHPPPRRGHPSTAGLGILRDVGGGGSLCGNGQASVELCGGGGGVLISAGSSEDQAVQVRRPRKGEAAWSLSGARRRLWAPPAPGMEKAKGAGAGGLQGPRPFSSDQRRGLRPHGGVRGWGEAAGPVSVALQPKRRQGGLGGVPLLPAPEDTAPPHPPAGQCHPGHRPLTSAPLPVDPPPLCSTVTPQATPSSLTSPEPQCSVLSPSCLPPPKLQQRPRLPSTHPPLKTNRHLWA